MFCSLTWHAHYRRSPHFQKAHFGIKRDRGLAPSYRSQSLGCPAETGVLKSSYVPTDTHCSCTIQHYVITSSLAGPPSNLCCLSDFVVTLLFFLLQFLWFLGHIQWYALKQLRQVRQCNTWQLTCQLSSLLLRLVKASQGAMTARSVSTVRLWPTLQERFKIRKVFSTERRQCAQNMDLRWNGTAPPRLNSNFALL